jgi:anti-anti-sigma factor
LQKGWVAGVTVDMREVSYLDPTGLRALLAAGEEARQAGKELSLEGVRTDVYKALHVAKLLGLFKRRQHG